MAPDAARQRPSTPRIRPARAAPSPPARPRVRSDRRRARRARTSAATPRSAATGAPAAAWTSLTRAESCASATAAGSAATARRPAASAAVAAGLLLRVGAANSGGRDRAADDARHGDQREDVGQGLEEGAVVRPALDVLEPGSDGAREAEQERGPEGAERPPPAEDQRREGDEPAPGGHVLAEGVDEADREEDASQRGQRARGGHARVADPVDRDAHRVCRARVLADRPDAEAERRLEHDDVREDEQGKAQPDHEVELAERVAEERAEPVRRDVPEEAQVHVGDARQVVRRAVVAVDVDEEVTGDPEREEV